MAAIAPCYDYIDGIFAFVQGHRHTWMGHAYVHIQDNCERCLGRLPQEFFCSCAVVQVVNNANWINGHTYIQQTDGSWLHANLCTSCLPSTQES